MKPQRLVLLALAFAATGAVGCFTDPTKDLRSGGTTLSVSDQAIYLRTGDSVAVVAELKDNQGNVLPAAGASWATGDATIADVRMDTVVIPGNYFTRGFIRGVTATGGWTSVIVTIGSVSDTLRVSVMPAALVASQVAFSGTAKADTVVIPAQLGPPPVAAKNVVVSAPDTLILNGTSVLNFDTSKVSVYANTPGGVITGYVIAKTPTQLKVVFNQPDSGTVVVKHILFVSGNASVGTIAMDSLVTGKTLVSRVRFTGAISQLGDTMTINAATGETFIASTGAKFGTTSAIVLTQTASAISVLSPVTYSGQVTVTNFMLGVATVPSATTNSGTPFAINAATFPAANVSMSPNNGLLGDTVIVTAPAGLSFVTGTGPSNVLLGNTAISTSDTAWILSRSASTIKAFAKRGGGGNLSVTKLKLASGTVIPVLATAAAYPIDSVNSDFINGGTEATAKPVLFTVGTPDTLYSSVNVNTTPQDFWTFTTTAAQNIAGNLAWFGTGNPGYGGAGNSDIAHTADLDMLLCNVGMACDESVKDLFGFGAATATQPEVGSTSAAQPAGQYWITAIAFTAGAESIVYRLILTIN